MASMELREGRPGDEGAIREVAVAAWHAAYDDVLGAETVTRRTDEWYDPDRVRDYLEDPDVAVDVAGDPAVGFALSRHDGETDRRELSALYVHPDRWREGVGSALLECVEARARAEAAAAVELVVLAGNEVGRSFYEGHGYERVGEREESIEEGVTELVYARALDS